MINAIRLFKLVGIDKIKAILAEDELEHFRVHLDGDDWKNPSIVMASDLHEIVDTFELVEVKGGLISSKKYLEFLQSSVDMGLYHGLDDVNCETEIPLISKAINLVEKCYE